MAWKPRQFLTVGEAAQRTASPLSAGEPPTTNHQPPTTNNQPPTTNDPSGEPVTCASVPSRSTRFTTNHQQPTTN
ncbi:MAG: hypothetical protein ACHBN1_28195 [Heteroscytonema crispum UTEX LB 1556]